MSEVKGSGDQGNDVRSSGHLLGHDILGVVLFALGGFLGVSVVTYLVTGTHDPQSLTAFVVDLVGLFGSSPVLWLCAGLVFVGVRLFLSGVSGGLGRDVVGFFVTALGLSILLGVFSQSLGGAFGVATGGAAADLLTPAGGAVLGIGALIGPAWFLWLRSEARARAGRPGREPLPALELDPRATPPADSFASGVSAEEASALLPSEAPEARSGEGQTETDGTQEVAGVIGGTWATWEPREPVVEAAPSPYPVDVRRQGGIPEGARPIEPEHAQSTSRSPTQAGAVHRWRPAEAGAAQLGAGAHLASQEDPAGRAGTQTGGPRVQPHGSQEPTEELSAPAARRAAPEPSRTVVTPIPAGPSASAVAHVAVPRHAPAAPAGETEAALVQPIPAGAASPPAPSWEQPDLFEEPVDAYGTPVSLVRSLRSAESAPPADVEAAEEDDREASEDEPREPGLFEDELAEEARLDEAAPADSGFDVDGEGERSAEAELDAPEPEDSEPAEREIVITPVQPEPIESAEPAARPGKSRRKKKAEAARTATRAAEPADSAEPHPGAEDLLQRAGNLILARKRVAVSMLQREFELDFKQATELLDQLQQAGLIGPYLGGQRRDILLTAEQWQERIGAS